MKRFKFSLETVHHLRELRRDQAERVLLKAAAEVAAAQTALAEIERQRDATETKLAGATGRIYADELAMQVAYLALLAQRERAARQRLSELEHERETRRAAVLAAAREAEITGQLRARQQARHAAEAARAEQNFLDEIAVTARFRRGAGNDE